MSIREAVRGEEARIIPLPIRPDYAQALLVVVQIGNLERLKASFGASAAVAVRSGVETRLKSVFGQSVAFYWDGESSLDALVPWERFSPGEEAGLMQSVLQTLAGSFAGGGEQPARFLISVQIASYMLDSDGWDRHPAELDRLRSALSQNPAGAAAVNRDGPWVARYRADMAKAVALYDAMREGRILLAWQPVVSADDPSIVLYEEALLRLDRQDGGRGQSVLDEAVLRSGGYYMAALERLNLIRALDAWVVGQVVDRLKADPAVRLACNISAQSVMFDAWWSALFAELVLAPDVAKRLVFEIAETAEFQDVSLAVEFCRRLRSLGCEIAIDDFGVGQASMHDIVALDPAIVKIDASFLRWASSEGLRDGAADELRHLIALVGGRGREVIMEGVETVWMRDVAVRAGARWLQGLWVAPPEPIARAASTGFDAAVPTGRGADLPLPTFLVRRVEEDDGLGAGRGTRFAPRLLIGLLLIIGIIGAGLGLWRWLA